MRTAAVIASAIVVFGAVTAHAAKLNGKIVIGQEFYQALEDAERSDNKDNRAFYWNEQNGILPVLPPLVDPASDFGVVMSQEGVKPAGPEDVKVVKVRATGLDRKVIVTRPGSTLKFKNVDPFEHELYSPELVTFEPQRQTSGSVRAFEFAAEGFYRIRCRLVPDFEAFVVVSRDPWIVKVKKDGSFVINDIEPGKYTIRVFYAGQWLHSESFEVPPKNRNDVETSLKLPAPDFSRSEPSSAPAKASVDAAGGDTAAGGEAKGE